MGQTEKSFLKVPTPIDGFNTDSARPWSTTSGAASLVWEEGMSRQPNCTILPECTHNTATTEQLPNAGSMPVHRQQRWYNIEPALVHRHVFVVHTQIAVSPVYVQHRSTGTMRIHLWPMSQTLIQF